MTTAVPASIRTARLELRPCTKDMARAAMTSRSALEEVLGVSVAEGWPSAELTDALPVYLAHLDREPDTIGWGLWLLVDPEQRLMIGDAGFKGQPDALGRVEVGYGVAPSQRDRGFATEAVEALIDWASQHGALLMTAECLDHNAASIRVLEKTGLVRKDRVNDMLKWELPLK